MKIYLASRFGRQLELRCHRDQLLALGFTVTSRWLDEECSIGAPGWDGESCARIDLEDVAAADVLLSFTETSEVGYMTGGRHVEYGAAWAMGKPLLVVGPRENVFHHLPATSVHGSFTEALAELLRMKSIGVCTMGRDGVAMPFVHLPIRDDVLYEAIGKWGRASQLNMVVGELGELLTLWGRDSQGRATTEDWASEIADCHIMLRQLALMIGEPLVASKIRMKMDRLMEKLKAGAA